jgi:hypothetical protein
VETRHHLNENGANFNAKKEEKQNKKNNEKVLR